MVSQQKTTKLVLCHCTNTLVLNMTLFPWCLIQKLALLFLVLNCQLGIKFKMDTIQTSLISIYTHCNQVDMLGLGLNLSIQ